MAIYKTVSSKEIVRKVMRDLNPNGAEWIHDAIEWIGEALEHIGASTQLETKVCTIQIKNNKALLPPDLYYINQVATGKDGIRNTVSDGIIDLKKDVRLLTTQFQETQETIASEVIKNTDGTYTSTLTTADLKYYSNLETTTINQMRQLNVRLAAMEVEYVNNFQGAQTLSYCTSSFPKGMHCEDCVNEVAVGGDCYMVENDYIKTSFAEGTVCMSYKAFPTDADCYPLVPDDISYKEAMFWYIFKKMVLGGYDASRIGMDYMVADQQWKYYCTQARNAAVFPDIDRMENFMNQWVRLIPNINRHAGTFDNLADREDLYRGIKL
tara:strand:- start:4050 stop:5021 length:972 start_codon:yes stop_codon:yes gene_type:complete